MPAASFWLRLHLLMRQRIPTLIGIIVLVIGVVAGVLLVGEGTGGFLPRASEEATPKQVRVTNITASSFTVSFTTLSSVTGSVQFGTSANDYDQEALDDRDQLSGQGTVHRTHHVTVRNLQPSSQYYFRIRTQGRHYFDNQGEPFTVNTGVATDEQADVASAQGEVVNQAGNPASNSLVYLTSSGASPLSAYVKQDGSWSLPLRQMRTKDLTSPFNFTDDTPLRMQIVSPDGQQNLEFAFRYNQVDQISTLQFGQEPDLSTETTNTSEETTAAGTQGQDLDLPSQNSLEGYLSDQERSAAQASDGVTIVFPRDENEVVTSTKPELSGQAPPGSTMQIQVHSDEAYYDVVEAQADGSWQWSPPAELEPGEHSVTLTYTDENGEQQQITRTFIVQADGTYPSFEATPSGSLASSPTPVPTFTPTPTPTPMPTPTPTPVSTPTPTPVSQVSPSPSATPIPGSQPVSGDSTSLWLMMAGASFFIGMGAVWKIGRPAKQTREWYK